MAPRFGWTGMVGLALLPLATAGPVRRMGEGKGDVKGGKGKGKETAIKELDKASPLLMGAFFDVCHEFESMERQRRRNRGRQTSGIANKQPVFQVNQLKPSPELQETAIEATVFLDFTLNQEEVAKCWNRQDCGRGNMRGRSGASSTQLMLCGAAAEGESLMTEDPSTGALTCGEYPTPSSARGAEGTRLFAETYFKAAHLLERRVKRTAARRTIVRQTNWLWQDNLEAVLMDSVTRHLFVALAGGYGMEATETGVSCSGEFNVDSFFDIFYDVGEPPRARKDEVRKDMCVDMEVFIDNAVGMFERGTVGTGLLPVLMDDYDGSTEELILSVFRCAANGDNLGSSGEDGLCAPDTLDSFQDLCAAVGETRNEDTRVRNRQRNRWGGNRRVTVISRRAKAGKEVDSEPVVAESSGETPNLPPFTEVQYPFFSLEDFFDILRISEHMTPGECPFPDSCEFPPRDDGGLARAGTKPN